MHERELGEPFAFSIPGWRSLGLLFFVLGLAFVSFSTFGNFDRTVSVGGLLVPVSGLARIVTPRAGMVTRLFVREGGLVAQGAPLLRIGSIALLPQGKAAAASELLALRHQAQNIGEEGEADRQRAKAQRRESAASLAQLTDAAASLAGQESIQRDRITNNEDRLRSLGGLRTKGYVSEATYLAQQEAVLSLRQQLAQLREKESDTRHSLTQTRAKLAELDAETRRSELQSGVALEEIERSAAGVQVQADMALAAPVAGRLAMLRVLPGSAVAAGEEVAAVVPGGDRIEALLFAPSNAIGAIRPGQRVRLRFDAFPYQRFGLGQGRVRALASASSTEAAEHGGATYRLWVTITRLPLGVSQSALRPDMHLSATIVVERRSLLDWLLAPVREAWHDRRDS